MPVALLTMDDSTIGNVPKLLPFIRSRSCGNLPTLDLSFDDVMRRALDKNSYAKRFRPLFRQLALLSFARNLMFFTAVAIGVVRALSEEQRESQEPENQEKPVRRRWLLELLPVFQGLGFAFSLGDLIMALKLWYSVRKMRGKWFLSAVNLWENTQISLGCFESDDLKVNLDLYFLFAVPATCYMVTCRRMILPFRQLFWAEVHDDGIDLSSISGRLYWVSFLISARICDVMVDLIDWSDLWVKYVVFVLLRRKEVFCIND
ncbi:uncharacterized protein LOC129599857 [Paramacrobiotus metropolitanus]|uniref:uncharacterized protein LOC129599857 n=1 Tax=Paramacrobiotus metropolitanus TaxID=2943436 RepID=UPI0024461362|nr:uncharacterized protein LOC129599857 [Paramacrobiotus metropolitanus]